MARTVRSVCPYDCPDTCGLLVDVEGDRAVAVRGDPEHPYSRGTLCPKMNRYQDTVHSPLRLSTPLERTGAKGAGAFRPVSWEEAVARIAGRWRAIAASHGGEAILPYSYAGTMGLVQRNAGHAFFHRLGASRLDRTICSPAKDAGWKAVMGDTPGPHPDEVEQSDLVILWGSNTVATNIHFVDRVAAARARGARVWTVDTYQTPTAALADRLVLVRPGSDAALALGLMHLLVREKLVDEAFVRDRVQGFQELAEQVLPDYPPGRTAALTGLAEADLEAMAREYGRARAPFIRVGSGLSRYGNGAMTVRAIACLPALVGAYGRRGGGCLTDTSSSRAFDLDIVTREGFLPGPTRLVNMNRLGHALTELRPPVLSLYVYSSNPAAVAPDQNAVLRGLAREDLFTVVHERFPTDTARFADLVLPATTSLEHPDLYRAYGHYCVQRAEPAIRPVGQAKSNWEVFQLLARAMGFEEPFFRQSARDLVEALLAAPSPWREGIDRAALDQGRAVELRLPSDTRGRFGTPSGKVEILNPRLAHALPAWLPTHEESGRLPFRLMTGASLYALNSSFQEREELRRRQRGMRLSMNPADAAARGLIQGQGVVAWNDLGEVAFQLEVTERAPRGVVVAEGVFWTAHAPGDRTVNALTSQRLTDEAGGSTFYDNRVDVRPDVPTRVADNLGEGAVYARERKERLAAMDAYLKHVEERQAHGIPPRPLDPEQTREVVKLLQKPPKGMEESLLALLRERVSPGVDPAAGVKAAFLAQIVSGKARSPLITKKDAIFMLGTMGGGYNVPPLVAALQAKALADDAAQALSGLIYVYDAFDDVAALAKAKNAAARKVLESWAAAEWFTSRPGIPDQVKVKVFRVDGEINTDDLSPAGDASTRPDIPLHALAMGKTRFPGGLKTIAEYRSQGFPVAFAGDVVGTGSSRKSACNSVQWHIGEDIPFVPSKRRGGLVLSGVIAPIFFATAQDSGALPVQTDVARLQTGDVVVVDFKKGQIRAESGEVLSTFELRPNTLPDEYRAGGRIPLTIGRALTDKARKALRKPAGGLFAQVRNPQPKPGQGYTLAQKIVGRACGLPGVLPGGYYEPRMTTVGSQDTTGPMTADELKELACLSFQTPMFMQSFCHTAAYPKAADVRMHKTLPQFVVERGGVSLKPGDGVIHSWLNRLLLPDTVGTGGDSHTRFPIGVSFPAGSGLVAFAGALGFMPLDMPESVRVRFQGKLEPGITLRDVVNAIPYWAIRQGLLTVPKKNKKNVFNGRILEMEGLPDLTVEQAFELTDAAAERSAAAATVKLSEKSVSDYLRSNAALMRKMIADGYADAQTLEKRIQEVEKWLKKPQLLSADAHAEYAAVIEIDLAEITQPILACPNDPDDVKLLSEVAGTKIDDVFLGSCMTNIGHFRAAGEIWKGQKLNPAVRTWICPPTRMDQQELRDEAYFSVYSAIGARIEVAGCSLCMGNQARVPEGATVFSTSTRNFDDRMGDGARVFLGSAELGAVASSLGRLPTPEEYFRTYRERIAPKADRVYRYLQFDELEEYRPGSGKTMRVVA